MEPRFLQCGEWCLGMEERSEEGRSLGDHPPGQVLQEERPGLGQGHEGPAEWAGGHRAWPRVSPVSPLGLL